MTPFEAFANITTLAALFSWANHRWIRLPTTIGLMVISMVSSLGLVALHALGVFRAAPLVPILRGFDFHDTLLNGMLGALLFAGALHLDLDDLLSQKWAIARARGGSSTSSASASPSSTASSSEP